LSFIVSYETVHDVDLASTGQYLHQARIHYLLANLHDPKA